MKHKLALPILLCLFSVFFAAGCGRVNHEAVLRDLKEDPGAGLLIEGVPFFPQDEFMCGPAALAAVMGYYGEKKGMDDVAREVYVEKLKGTLPIDLLIYAKEKGFDAAYYGGSLDDLKEKISGKKPLILFLNLGLESYPVGHYITAVGYDDKLKVVIAHSGLNREEVFSYNRLLNAWGKTNFSTLLITPKKGL